jgi:two-component system, NarL family, invasion response regulator UvrY
MKRILVVDDHAVVRRGLQQIVSDSLDAATVDEAKDGEEAVAQVQKSRYDLVLLDISLPGRTGIDVLKDLKAIQTDLPILMLSIHPEEQFAIRALRAGASGYLTKACPPEELITAIRRVLSGEKYISATFAQQLISNLDKENAVQPHENLSDREYQVLCLIARGKTPKQIGTELKVNIKTVSTYRSRILDKMNIQSNAEITRYCLEHNLID